MAVAQTTERLYFATHSTVCWRLISGSEIYCQSYDTSGYTFNEIYIPPRTDHPLPLHPLLWSFPP
jgi:hypothetical protein